MASRALQRKSGETDIELTTGDFDRTPSTPTGSFTRVQIATPDAAGRRQMVKEYPNLAAAGGYVAFTYSGLPRGQALHVQANVTGIDGARTDIVTATPTVRLRPDLSLQRVSAPSTGLVGVPVAITAVIAELNQDLGARAACALLVDGVEVDTAEGIWVDAGGLVSCAFTFMFATTGIKSIEVQARDVVPAEYDMDNNAARTSIHVREDQLFDYYTVDARSIETSHGWHYQDWSTRSENAMVYGRDIEEERLTHQTDRYIGYFAVVHKPIDFPITQFSVAESTDGARVRAIALTDIGGRTSMGGCAIEYAGNPAVSWLQICSSRSANGAGLTVLQYGNVAGEVTYYSRGFDASWHRSPDGVVITDASYSWNATASWLRSVPPLSEPALTAWGSTYEVDVTLISGDTIFRGPLTMTLQHETVSRSMPWQCSESSGDWGWKRFCSDLVDVRVEVSGYAPR